MFRKFTFWLPIISLIIIMYNMLGFDDKNIFLIGMNPVLNELIYMEPYSGWMMDVQENKILFASYVLHFITFVGIGLILDSFVIRMKCKKRLRKHR